MAPKPAAIRMPRGGSAASALSVKGILISKGDLSEGAHLPSGEELFSFTKPYSYLIEDFIPRAIRNAFASLNLEVSAVERRLNLPKDSCVHYDKTQLYQWYVHFH